MLSELAGGFGSEQKCIMRHVRPPAHRFREHWNHPDCGIYVIFLSFLISRAWPCNILVLVLSFCLGLLMSHMIWPRFFRIKSTAWSQLGLLIGVPTILVLVGVAGETLLRGVSGLIRQSIDVGFWCGIALSAVAADSALRRYRLSGMFYSDELGKRGGSASRYSRHSLSELPDYH
jgi:hypothetical protein